jgi:2-(1,2-epoxy-1,2-dihydrophenyl)acetyl-CoA isomerase
MVKALETHDLETQLRYEVANIRIAFGSEDGKEARRAFLEKRKPVFSGR